MTDLFSIVGALVVSLAALAAILAGGMLLIGWFGGVLERRFGAEVMAGVLAFVFGAAVFAFIAVTNGLRSALLYTGILAVLVGIVALLEWLGIDLPGTKTYPGDR